MVEQEFYYNTYDLTSVISSSEEWKNKLKREAKSKVYRVIRL